MTEKKKPGRPAGTKRVDPETALEKRATFIIRKDLLNKVQLLAVSESYRQTVEVGHLVTVKQKDIVNNALDEYVTKHEEKHGKL